MHNCMLLYYNDEIAQKRRGGMPLFILLQALVNLVDTNSYNPPTPYELEQRRGWPYAYVHIQLWASLCLHPAVVKLAISM